AANYERVPPGAFGILIQEQPGNPGGNGADGQEPQQHAVILGVSLIAHVSAASLYDDLNPVGQAIDHHREQGADVEEEVEIQRLRLPSQQPGGEVKVRGAADGQELCKPLDDSQDDDVRKGHKESACGIEAREVKSG